MTNSIGRDVSFVSFKFSHKLVLALADTLKSNPVLVSNTHIRIPELISSRMTLPAMVQSVPLPDVQPQPGAAAADPQQLKAALAVALAERKDKTKASEAEWKRKALAARSSLLRLSKAVKRSEASSPESATLASALLTELPEDLHSWGATAQQAAPGTLPFHVATRAGNLQGFMDAVEVVTSNPFSVAIV